MRSSPNIPERVCRSCGCTFKPSGNTQIYCLPCGKSRDKARKQEFYRKTNPNAKPKVKRLEPCCICGEPFSASFNGKPYCNKHYLRMYNNGDVALHPRQRTNTYHVEGDTATVTTSNGKTFVVDTSDLPVVQRYSWCFSRTGYLVANICGKVVKLHRYLLDVPNGVVVDHINGNPSDNRRVNLRLCSPAENSQNTSVSKNSKSGYLGIMVTRSGRYSARICVNRTEIRLGTYDTLDEAISAREKAEKRYFGEYAPSASRGKIDTSTRGTAE